MTTVHHFSAQEAIDYIKNNTALFPPAAQLTARLITGLAGETDGYVNIIHLVKDADSGRSVAFKQVLPYIRAAQENNEYVPLPLNRMAVEVAVFKLWRIIDPALIPQIYHRDDANAILIMEDLSALNLLRFEMMKMKRFPRLPEAIGGFLGKSAFYFSDMHLDAQTKHELAQTLANPQLRALFDRFIFEETFFTRKPINPLVQDDLDRLLADESLLREVLQLKEIYGTQAHTLIHNDFHTSNICVNGSAIKIFDAEAACFGPIAFDLARLLGSTILNYASWEGVAGASPAEKEAYRSYLLQFITEVYRHFAQAFTAAWQAHARPEYRRVESYLKLFLETVLRDTVGFAGCVCLARIYNQAECYEFQQFDSPAQKATAQRLAMAFTRQLIMKRRQVKQIEDFTELIRQTEQEHRIEQAVWQTIRAFNLE